MLKRRLVVVGAGPIGLEAALRAARDGFNVTVLEQGRVGEAVRSWSHIRLFTPFGTNSSVSGRQVAAAQIADDEIVTGGRFSLEYLMPLAESELLQGHVHEMHEVLAVSRDFCGKSDRIGMPDRGKEPFRILVRTEQGERIFSADILLDCTGFISTHRFAGAGGMPCPGEMIHLAEEHYRLPDITGDEEERFANRHTLVIGSGYSAATSILLLDRLAIQNPNTHATWITRGNRSKPITEIPNDALGERDSLARAVNRIAAESSHVHWLPGPNLDSILRDADRFRVDLLWPEEFGEGRADHILVDEVIANVGYRPNPRPFEELQIHRCYATDGPIKLAAHLLGETSGDCLQQNSAGPELLKNPEPNFFILGAASYGRDNRFLLRNGLQQIDDLFTHLAQTSGVTV